MSEVREQVSTLKSTRGCLVQIVRLRSATDPNRSNPRPLGLDSTTTCASTSISVYLFSLATQHYSDRYNFSREGVYPDHIDLSSSRLKRLRNPDLTLGSVTSTLKQRLTLYSHIRKYWGTHKSNTRTPDS